MKPIVAYVGALTDAALAREHLGIKRTTDEQEALLAFLMNAASADLEGFTGRRLKSRAYAGTSVLKLRSDGSIRIVSPEYPVTAVASIQWRDRNDGTMTALDLAGMDFDGNWIEVPAGGAPAGTMIHLACTAGYDATLHPGELARLEAGCLRILTIKWQDKEKHIGRAMEATLPNGGISYTPTELPEDLQREIWWARRI